MFKQRRREREDYERKLKNSSNLLCTNDSYQTVRIVLQDGRMVPYLARREYATLISRVHGGVLSQHEVGVLMAQLVQNKVIPLLPNDGIKHDYFVDYTLTDIPNLDLLRKLEEMGFDTGELPRDVYSQT